MLDGQAGNREAVSYPLLKDGEQVNVNAHNVPLQVTRGGAVVFRSYGDVVLYKGAFGLHLSPSNRPVNMLTGLYWLDEAGARHEFKAPNALRVPPTPRTGDAVDVHILAGPGRRPSPQLLEQLENEPVKVHIMDSLAGELGTRTRLGFETGEAPIVSALSPDAVIVPGIYCAMLDQFHMQPELDALATREHITNAGRGLRPKFFWQYYNRAHLFRLGGLVAYKRATLTPFLPAIEGLEAGVSRVLWALLLREGARILHLPEIGCIRSAQSRPRGGDPRAQAPARVRAIFAELKQVNDSTRGAAHIPEQRRILPPGLKWAEYRDVLPN